MNSLTLVHVPTVPCQLGLGRFRDNAPSFHYQHRFAAAGGKFHLCSQGSHPAFGRLSSNKLRHRLDFDLNAIY